MSTKIGISYYNCFVLAGGSAVGKWHVEESRIKGGFNETSTDYGARAYATDENYTTRRRGNAMMYSGIYNSKTKFNGTNKFPIGSAITRAVDLSHGSIQKLYAEDTNLNIFQENKVSRALIDKDAIFTAEGGNLTVSGSKVIGQVVPYLGKYGISTNPESFAIHGGRKYFTDKNRAVVLRLTRDGVTPISSYGMKSFFRDNLKLADKAYGMYDEVNDHYILSLQGSDINQGKKVRAASPVLTTDNSEFVTIGFGERVKGWVSLYSYKPSFGTSLSNRFLTFNGQSLYEHYTTNSEYMKFYGATFKDPSYLKFIMNEQPQSIKTFHTINYEGSSGWSMESGVAENVNRAGTIINEAGDAVTVSNPSLVEQAFNIPKKGVTILDENNIPLNVGFELKESKYYKELRQNIPYDSSDFNASFNRNTLNLTSGIKGYHAVFELQYWEPTEVVEETKAELFAVSNEINISSK